MRLTKCEKKHFYDADEFNSCPHCAKNSGTPNAQSRLSAYVQSNLSDTDRNASAPLPPKPKVDTLTPKTDSIFEQNSASKTERFIDQFNVGGTAFCAKCGEEGLIDDAFCGGCGEVFMPQRKTPAVSSEPTAPPKSIPTPVNEVAPPAPPPVENIPATRPAPIENNPAPVPAPPPPVPQPPPAPLNSLQSQVNAVVSHGQTEDLKTVAFYDFPDTKPVVGWLVCTGGEYVGESFNLKAGQNFVGRALNMDVPLAKDISVSRNKHSIITYDAQNRLFFVQPGESSGVTYVNGNLLLAHQPLNAYDNIKVGNSELVFIPFCGERFSW